MKYIPKINKKLYFLFRTNGKLLFLTYCLFVFLITYVTNNFILTDSVYVSYLEQQYSFEKITQITNFIDKWKWMSYVLSPLLYTIKFFVLSICILIGIMLSDLKISFNKVFKIVLVSEIVFLLAIVFKTIYFLFINTSFTIEESQTYYPLSLINYFDSTKLEVWLKYPLQLVNLFELTYILLISSGLSIALRLNYRKSLSIVSLSYLTGLLIWVVFITFLTVNFGA